MAANEWKDTLIISEILTLIFFIIFVIGGLVIMSGSFIEDIFRRIIIISLIAAPAASIACIIIFPKAEVKKHIGMAFVIQTICIVFVVFLIYALSLRSSAL